MKDPLDVVIFNAGLVTKLRQLTEDGIEKTVQVNHLGHFLLLSLLQDKLNRGARVIFVASSLHKNQDAAMTLRAMRNADGPLKTTEPIYKPMTAYAQSKLLQAWCIAGWDRELAQKGVSVILASAGFVPTTGLAREESPVKQFLMRWVLHYAPFARSMQQAGTTIAACALAEEMNKSNVYVDAQLRETRMHEAVYDEQQADEVWTWSRKQCGL
jgi:NAD(P)-dependent dehydrogenase (short-subunit alcohol dehydrogenase family)